MSAGEPPLKRLRPPVAVIVVVVPAGAVTPVRSVAATKFVPKPAALMACTAMSEVLWVTETAVVSPLPIQASNVTFALTAADGDAVCPHQLRTVSLAPPAMKVPAPVLLIDSVLLVSTPLANVELVAAPLAARMPVAKPLTWELVKSTLTLAPSSETPVPVAAAELTMLRP